MLWFIYCLLLFLGLCPYSEFLQISIILLYLSLYDISFFVNKNDCNWIEWDWKCMITIFLLMPSLSLTQRILTWKRLLGYRIFRKLTNCWVFLDFSEYYVTFTLIKNGIIKRTLSFSWMFNAQRFIQILSDNH